jgi:hypothetical protein
MAIRGRKRKISYEAIVKFAKKNPTMIQADIAAKFGTTQSRISSILCESGIKGIRRGRPLAVRPSQSDEQHKWETILHDAGLGMDRGLRLNKHRILYGYDIRKESLDDGSATRITGL